MFMTKLFSTTCALLVLGIPSLFAAAQDAPLSDELVTAGTLRQLALSAPQHLGKEMVPEAPILNLPDEMLLKILGYTDIKSLGRLSQTCHSFRNIIAESFTLSWKIEKPQGAGHIGLDADFVDIKGQPQGRTFSINPFAWETHVPSLPPYVRSLFLPAIDLSEKIEIISEMLKTNTSLTALYLQNNDINAAGATALATALKTNTTLTLLDLSYNDIGAAGVRRLGDALKTNRTLTWLDLSDNQIGGDGVRNLANDLKSNTALTLLTLKENPINDTAKAQLRNLAAARPGLEIEF